MCEHRVSVTRHTRAIHSSMGHTPGCGRGGAHFFQIVRLLLMLLVLLILLLLLVAVVAAAAVVLMLLSCRAPAHAQTTIRDALCSLHLVATLAAHTYS